MDGCQLKRTGGKDVTVVTGLMINNKKPSREYVNTAEWLLPQDILTITLWISEEKLSCIQVFDGHTPGVMHIKTSPKGNNTHASASLNKTQRWLDHQTVRLGENVPLHTTIWRELLTWCGTLSTLNTATHRHYVTSQNLKGFSGKKLSEDQTGKSFLGEKWLDNWLCWNKSDSTFQEGQLSFRLRKWLVMVLGGLSVRRVC